MATHARQTRSFPTACIPSTSGGLPVEVSLIAQLGHGAGDQLFVRALARQQAHATFIDELDEPSARLGAPDLARGDATSLYSFAVGAQGHPFHRHAGHRVFTAVSGSGGARLRFSTATPAQVEADPGSFIQALHCIDIPPDCLFTVRFGGDTWHQFTPLAKRSRHPAFFALSCHTNELGGDLPQAKREQVLAGATSIPSLTELLPAAASEQLRRIPLDQLHVPTTQLSLDVAPGAWQGLLCQCVRRMAGVLRGAWATGRRVRGFLGENGGQRAAVGLDQLPSNCLLAQQTITSSYHHQDLFRLAFDSADVAGHSAAILLGRVLDGFLANPPPGVTRLMALRNRLVKPAGLRTSPLGCPVSSLLAPPTGRLFQQRYPVLAQAIAADGRHAQVILGADDKHLIFRSCVGVQITGHRVEVTLGTRVRCRNLFGRLYMAAIDRVHRSYIAPTMLRMAVEHAFPRKVTTPDRFPCRVIATESHHHGDSKQWA